ncbi:hypothetical protein N2597_03140 [Rhizobium sophoriradicis]|uniref:hypothetical protein n=1 Tax=Rhizobium sophoriradicis TaxID=1535245 RepID=UPI0016138737|nr:hypothetical protein N2597_03140 [Rhizobium leguminosarum bv. phaseoli]
MKKAQKKLCGAATLPRKALFPSGQENRTGGPATRNGSWNRSDPCFPQCLESRLTPPSLLKTAPRILALYPESASQISTSATLSARHFQRSNQVALKQLLMQVSEKSITQMGYGAQDSRPFLVFIAESAKNARDLLARGPQGRANPCYRSADAARPEMSS